MNAVVFARHLAERVGVTGILGVALLAFSATFVVGTLLPMHAEREAQAELRARAASPTPAAPAALSGPAESERQLSVFYAFFPPAATATHWLREILAAATASGLVVDNGEYRLQREKGRSLVRYQIALPVVGSYAKIRRFIAHTRDAVPAAVLEEVTLKRESRDDQEVEARIRYTLYLSAAKP